MKYLDAPHIQMGFYWDSIPCTRAYSAACRWLVGNGFRHAPGALLILPVQSEIPAYTQLNCNNLANQSLRPDPTWSLESLNEVAWLPVRTQFTSTGRQPILVELGYARMAESAVSVHSNRVVEITMSGACTNLLDNVGDANVSPKVRARAKKTLKLRERLFAGVCQALQPDYASNCEEWSLQPPEALDLDGRFGVLGEYYISESLMSFDEVADICKPAERFDVRQVESGVDVKYRGMDSLEDVNVSAEVSSQVRLRLRARKRDAAQGR